LQVGHERGLLLRKEEVLAAQRMQNANVRTRLRMLPRAMAQELATVTVPAEIERILLAYIDRQLSDLASDPLALQTSAAGASEESTLPHASALVSAEASL
jgi:hypothetical protein